MSRFTGRRRGALLTLLGLAWGGSALWLSQSPAWAQSPQTESWADENLPVKTGLSLWLDASRLPAARQARLGQETLPEGAVDLWPDASGHARDVKQSDEKQQPTYRVTDGFHAVRFDGIDDVLAHTGPDPQPRDVSVILVTAPFDNAGGFQAFLSLSEAEKSDFLTGLNLDQGIGTTLQFDTLNVEGAGANGFKDLFNDELPFGSVLRLCVVSQPGQEGIAAFVNGQPAGYRERQGVGHVHLGQITIGARYYLAFGPPAIKAFYHGEIAEVLVYDRALDDEERNRIEEYLKNKYAKAGPLPIPEQPGEGKRLIRVEDPPPVQVFLPGFVVRKLPLDLKNINNVQYRPDGKLVALQYDGQIILLSDTDQDGLPDTVETFWANDSADPLRAPIGMALTPSGSPHGQGVFVAAKGKCVLLVDTDGDNRADREIVVADGWQELPHGVDALGMAVDPHDGSVYFGLGTANFTNAYLVKEGKASYSLTSERGTILKVAPDFRSREIFATGIRFPVGIRFNPLGDLFCTDQEGATWLKNGNPQDELLHVQRGRHYGFPPRHPQYLPDVIDEPSTYDYRPQHQSTCGLNFNTSVNGGPIFGPTDWEQDCFVTGYSRGKLYRTQLFKTAEGYLARNQMFACLDQLTVDACISPDGGLIVATHSGAPDWGTGATGAGQLFKIEYAAPDLPQPSLIWPQSPRELRIAFDRPVAPEFVTGLQSAAVLEYGQYVSAGDRFETLKPPYQVVRNQMNSPRFDLPIHSVQVTPDRRTLIVVTAPHPDNASYALTLPGLGRETINAESRDRLPQLPETDLQYDLTGLEATWTSSADQTVIWTGWLPHLDLHVAQRFTRGSADHDQFWEISRAPGTLSLRTNLRLENMLRPELQPGETPDFEWPEETVTVTFRSRSAFQLSAGPDDEQQTVKAQQSGEEFVASFTVTGKTHWPVQVDLQTDGHAPDLRVSWHTQEDPRPRPWMLNRLLLPWAPLTRQQETFFDVTTLPELQGGDWGRGRAVFFSEDALCSKCHTVRGEGGQIGPDLSNLPHRDYESVLRDIRHPSAAINPDFLTQSIALDDGQVLVGVVRTEGDKLIIGDATGKVTEIHRDQVERMLPASLSVMPEKLLEKIGPEKTKDLLTYLLVGPPRMPDYGAGTAPGPRTRDEVEQALAGSSELPDPLRPLNIVLVAGRKDHGPGEHDYPAWKTVWQRLMSLAPSTTIETAEEWPSLEQQNSADVLVFYQQGSWTPQRAREMDAYLARGGGLVYIHYAVDGGQDAPGFAQRIGLAWKGGASAFRHGPLDLGFEPGQGHPIARNFESLHLHDESYWQLIGDPARIDLLATGLEAGQQQPLFWTLSSGNGRVFVSIPGHFSWTFDDPLFRLLLLRGIAWAADEPVDRFNALIWPGARIAE